MLPFLAHSASACPITLKALESKKEKLQLTIAIFSRTYLTLKNHATPPFQAIIFLELNLSWLFLAKIFPENPVCVLRTSQEMIMMIAQLIGMCFSTNCPQSIPSRSPPPSVYSYHVRDVAIKQASRGINKDNLRCFVSTFSNKET